MGGSLLKHRLLGFQSIIFDSVGLEWDLKIRISNKLPGGAIAQAHSSGTIALEHLVLRLGC